MGRKGEPLRSENCLVLSPCSVDTRTSGDLDAIRAVFGPIEGFSLDFCLFYNSLTVFIVN